MMSKTTMKVCKRCTFIVTRPRGESWDQGLCSKCFHSIARDEIKSEPVNQEKIFPEFIRIATVPTDLYLDRFTLHEMELIDQ